MKGGVAVLVGWKLNPLWYLSRKSVAHMVDNPYVASVSEIPDFPAMFKDSPLQIRLRC